jgi:hypothetical protein
MPGWVLCSDCYRVLWIEDGPTCPECLAKRRAEKAEELIVEASLSHQPMPVARVKSKAEGKSE